MKRKVVKQYTIEIAYNGNYRITTYENGEKIESGIVSWYEVDGYKTVLEEMCYTRAFDVKYYYDKYREAELDFVEAKKQYEYAQKHPLYKKEN